MDGLGFMVFLYAIKSKEEKHSLNQSSRASHQREDEWAILREKAMDTIRKDASYPQYEKAKALVFNYQKENYSHPELALESKLREIMATGKTLNEAIDELYEVTIKKN